MAEENPLVYSPIQNSVYTAIEYKAHTNGVAPDMSPAALGSQYYHAAFNVLPRGGKVVTREGTSKQIGTAVAEGYLGGAEWILANGSAQLMAAFTGGIRRLDTALNSWETIMTSAFTLVASGAHVDFVPMRTASSGLRIVTVVESPATSATMESVRWWNGSTSTTFTVLTTAVQGNCGVVWKSHLLLGDTIDTGDGHIPYRIHWSALGDPTVWSGTASAGSLDLTDGNLSKVMRFLPLRKELAAYKEFGAYTLTYKGNPFWFTQTLLSEQLTLVGRNAVCSVLGGDAHFIFSTDGMVLWDGQTYKNVGKDKVDRTILREIDWSRRAFTAVSYFPHTKEVLVSYLLRESADLAPQAWVYNLEYDSWWRMSRVGPFGGSVIYKTFSSAAPMLMLANRNVAIGGAGNVVGMYSGWTDSGSTGGQNTINASLEVGPLDFGHFGHKRTLKTAPILLAVQTDPTATAPTIPVTVDVYEREIAVDVKDTGGSSTFSYSITPASPMSLVYLSGHLSSRYVRTKLAWNSLTGLIEFAGMVFHAALRGDARIQR